MLGHITLHLLLPLVFLGRYELMKEAVGETRFQKYQQMGSSP